MEPLWQTAGLSAEEIRTRFDILVATAASGIVVGVEVTNAGSDAEEMAPMLDQLNTIFNPLKLKLRAWPRRQLRQPTPRPRGSRRPSICM